MKIFRSFFYILLTTVVMLAGCAPVYVPSARHTHQLDKKGELSAGGFAGTNGADVQLGYAVSDKWGIVAAGSFSPGNTDDQSDDFHEHRYGEAAIQYHGTIGKIGRFELITGAGTGSATSVDTYSFTQNEVRATGTFNKFFLQPNIGLETGVIEAGLALRTGHVVYTEFETTQTRFTDNSSATFFEPALFTRLGWKAVKLEGQVGYSASVNENVGFDYQPFFLTMGLHISLNTTGQ